MLKIINVNSCWNHIRNVCRTTINKEHDNKEPSRKFKKNLLISEHSPIRELVVKWKWSDIKSWIGVHYSRHRYECYVSTQRTDRTGVNRDDLPQSSLVDMDNTANAQHLIDVMRKRLCYGASKETRELAEELKYTLKTYEEELSDVLVPNCIYRCGCPEMSNCGFFKRFVDEYIDDDLYEISDRYDKYNKYFDWSQQ